MFKTVVFSTVELITVVVDEITGVSVVVQRGFLIMSYFGQKTRFLG